MKLATKKIKLTRTAAMNLTQALGWYGNDNSSTSVGRIVRAIARELCWQMEEKIREEKKEYSLKINEYQSETLRIVTTNYLEYVDDLPQMQRIGIQNEIREIAFEMDKLLTA